LESGSQQSQLLQHIRDNTQISFDEAGAGPLGRLTFNLCFVLTAQGHTRTAQLAYPTTT